MALTPQYSILRRQPLPQFFACTPTTLLVSAYVISFLLVLSATGLTLFHAKILAYQIIGLIGLTLFMGSILTNFIQYIQATHQASIENKNLIFSRQKRIEENSRLSRELFSSNNDILK